MNEFIQNMIGMGGMTDQVIATDLLISAKSSVHNYSVAITEATTPELRAALKEQLFAAIDTHEAVSNYMTAKGYYHPHHLGAQMSVDLTTADTALKLADQR